MSTYTQIYYHLVWSVKDRTPALTDAHREHLLRYITGILKHMDCHLYRINGTSDHLHIFTSLHPSVALADLIREIKIGSSKWMKGSGNFPIFTHWQDGYGAFTVSHSNRDAVIEYIKNQGEHHRKLTFADELQALLEKAGIPYNPRFLE